MKLLMLLLSLFMALVNVYCRAGDELDFETNSTPSVNVTDSGFRGDLGVLIGTCTFLAGGLCVGFGFLVLKCYKIYSGRHEEKPPLNNTPGHANNSSAIRTPTPRPVSTEKQQAAQNYISSTVSNQSPGRNATDAPESTTMITDTEN